MMSWPFWPQSRCSATGLSLRRRPGLRCAVTLAGYARGERHFCRGLRRRKRLVPRIDRDCDRRPCRGILGEALTWFGKTWNSVFYCAESVLLSEDRAGATAGSFADARRMPSALTFRERLTFCAVPAPRRSPLAPAAHRSLDPVWRCFGLAPSSPASSRTLPLARHRRGAETDKPLAASGENPVHPSPRKGRACRIPALNGPCPTRCAAR